MWSHTKNEFMTLSKIKKWLKSNDTFVICWNQGSVVSLVQLHIYTQINERLGVIVNHLCSGTNEEELSHLFIELNVVMV